MKAEPAFWPDIPELVWDRIRDEFTLPPLADVERRLAAAHSDPEPYRRRLVRIFLGDGTFCPGFQFTGSGTGLHPAVLRLFEGAMALCVPHNVFAAWMVQPSAQLGARPVDSLGDVPELHRLLEDFSRRRLPGT